MGRAVTPLLRVTARVCYSCIEQQQHQQQHHNRSNSMNSSSVHGSSSGSEDAALALEALTEALKLLLCALGARGRLTAAQGHKEVSLQTSNWASHLFENFNLLNIQAAILQARMWCTCYYSAIQLLA
jgi:hypothetical protein